VRGYLGLGSNVGDRLTNLRQARRALAHHQIPVLAFSSAYRTEPQGEVTDQRDFFNACVCVDTNLCPEELLAACKEIERQLGRSPGQVRHGPRSIDIDVLLLGDISYRSQRLVLPHRDVLGRRFVLVPLLELDRDLTLPDGTPVSAGLESTEGQRVERIGTW
jgi:2-amino-4-hydroxy-6-hydroxymethyldihydropteridine diphosphokinase